MVDKSLGNFRTFAAMDLSAAANRRRRAAEMGPHDKPMRRRLLDNARFLLLEARHCRMKRKEAERADEMNAIAAKLESAGEPILASSFRNEARKAEYRAMSMPHPAFR